MFSLKEINESKIVVIISLATVIAGIVGFLTIYIPGDRRYITATQIWMITSILKEFSQPVKESQESSLWNLLFSLVKQFITVIIFGLFAELIARNTRDLVKYAPAFENIIYMGIAASITLTIGFLVVLSQNLLLSFKQK
jgi:uncharacterized protein (DUF697 family)